MNKKQGIIFVATTSLMLSGAALSHVILNSNDVVQAAVVRSADSRTVTVDPAAFRDYFQVNGSADVPYDTSTWTQTLTPNAVTESGNVTLKTKIDMSQNFDFKGYVNLGNKSKNQGGADGVGILFQPGNVNVVGENGGALGIGEINGAFGFKLDTFYNDKDGSGFTADPSEFSSGESFGAFVDGTSGKAVTIADTAKEIAQPSVNTFRPIDIEYNGSTKTMTITYDGQTWSRDISDWLGDNTAMSFAISASTGANYNLQQLQNVTFTYTVAQGKVNANYVDDSGNTIAPEVTTEGDIDSNYATTQKEIPGYTFEKVTGDSASGEYTANDKTVTYVYTRNQGTADVKYIDDTANKTLLDTPLSGNTGDKSSYTTADTIKKYESEGYELVSDNYPADSITFGDTPQYFEVHLKHGQTVTNETKQVNETIHYVYSDGSQAADDYKATPVEFTRTVTTDNVTGEKTYGGWTPTTGTSFAKVTSPVITGYTPDKSEIGEITGITDTSSDVEETVTYTKSIVPKQPFEPATPTGNDTDAGTGTAIKKVVDKKTVVPVGKKTLPQTGDEQNNNVLWGIALIALAGAGFIIVLARRNKKI